MTFPYIYGQQGATVIQWEEQSLPHMALGLLDSQMQNETGPYLTPYRNHHSQWIKT